jgi:hypothetical protein
MTGGARTNGCSEQKAEDGRSFHRLSDGAITILLRSTSLRLGTCATCPDKVCRSGFQSQNGRAPKAAYSGEARLSACTSLVENQIRELRQVAGRRGWDVVEVYSDAGISAPRDEPDAPASIPCSRTPAGGSSMSLWLGRLTACSKRFGE